MSRHEAEVVRSTVHWPQFYKPFKPEGFMGRAVHGCSCPALDFPPHLLNYAKVKDPHPAIAHTNPELAHTRFATFSSERAPAVLLTEGNRHGTAQLVQLLEFMDASNMPRDWIFRGMKANLLVRPVDFPESSRPKQFKGKGYMLGLEAVQFSYTDLLANYDKLYGQHFADPSYPRRETDGD